MSCFELQGKVVLVTGASSGLGREISVSIAKCGANCFLTGRNEQRLIQTCNLLSGGKHQYLAADLTSISERSGLINSIPVLDGLVLSSGMLVTKPVGFWTEQNVNEILNANFSGVALLVSEIVKNRKLGQGGSIVFISSIAGNVIAHKGNGLYSASKGAINALLKVLALELAPRRIRVNAVLPGMIRTDLWEGKSFDKQQLEIEERKYPLGFGSATDVSNSVVFLLSDATKWITGAELVIDGGYSLQ
ncbi:MAG: SDR family oxidoreductase [Cyclobacteriaceae bacterium]|nr:SDR family oxidoreductase [Cyclobacteriaceae bacterium]